MIQAVRPNAKNALLAQQVVDCCHRRQYPLRTEEGEINIIAIEGMDLDGSLNLDRSDRWNDLVGILTFDHSGTAQFEFLARATTEPGEFYTNNPAPGIVGVARLDTGYHKNLWQVGTHRGYEALAQNGNVARLVRDRNRDYRRNDKVSEESWRGINLHTTKTTGWRGSASPHSIGPWSAGCVVIYQPSEFLDFMERVKDSYQYRVNSQHSFDCILLWSGWLSEDIKAKKQKPAQAIQASEADLEVMAKTIWGEARGESDEGKVAVGWVIRNRVERSPKYGWPTSIREVCLQKWQFSCWLESDPNYEKIRELPTTDPSFQACLEIAKQVVSGEVADPTNGADHYYAKSIAAPRWTNPDAKVADIGHHVFYLLS